MAIRWASFNRQSVKYLSPRCAATLTVVMLAIVAGCKRREYPGEQRYALSGKVTVDGAPMQFGLITFQPDGEGGIVSGGPIKDGAYSIPEPKGPTAGKYRVLINWNKPTGKKVKDAWGEEIMDEYKEGLPAKYHSASELTAEVSEQKTTFDFSLQTK
jgi:hypothetical protein